MNFNLKIGQHYRIKRLHNILDKNYRKKLLSMGLMPGAELTITRMAPLGDPIQLKVNDFALSLRKAQLRQFELEAL